MKALLLFYSVSFLFFVGCASEDSSSVETSAIHTTYSVSGSGSVSAQFNVGGALGTFLELTGGDSISVNGTTLSKVQIGNLIQYTGTISVNAGDTVTFTFSRSGEDAHISTVVMPEAISIDSPADGSSSNSGDQLTVTWTAGDAGDTVTATLNKEPSDETDASRSSDDSNGTVTFTTDDTDKVSGSSIAATIELTRSSTGTVSSSHDGTVTASQTSDSIDVTLN